MNTRLLLVRHGQTAWNLEWRFMGQADIPLDETGQGQALAVAARLAAERPAVIYSSDLRRARDTALAIQSSVACGAQVLTDPRLREMHFGDWQGRTYSEIKEQDPQALISWEANGLEVAPPHGETLLLFGERVQSAYQDICAAYPDQTVIIAGHGGSLQLLIIHALGLPPETFWHLHLSNASLSELRIHDSGGILYLLNDTSHLFARV
jgi:alpha-ribazole phosphatase